MKQAGHLCVVTTAHPIDDVRVYSKVVRSFTSAGWRVTWVGIDQYYFTSQPLSDPSVTHVLLPPPRTRLGRLGIHRSLRAAAREIQAVDWYYTPDPDGVSVILDLAKGDRASTLFDIHEAYHGALLTRWTLGRPLPVLPELVKGRIRHLSAQCDIVTGVSRSLLETYAVGIPDERTVLLRNAAPLPFSDGASPPSAAMDGRPLRFMHGKALATNGTPVLLDAARILMDRGRDDFEIVVFDRMKGAHGEYDQELRTRIEELGVGAVIDAQPGVPHSEMTKILDSCDVGLIAYGRQLGEDSLPNRFFEYLARGLPVIVPEYSPEMSEVVAARKLGTTADFESAQDVADALERMIEARDDLRAIGTRSLETFTLSAHWEHDFQNLLTALSDR